jgi:hypothetical protein
VGIQDPGRVGWVGRGPPGHELRARGRRGRAAIGGGSELATPGAVVDRLFRRESGRAVATLIRILGDFDRAEEARTIPTVGGHEYLSPNAAPYFSYFGAAAGDPARGYYSYELGGWHVISLNTYCSAVGGCQAGSAMEQWLRQDLLTHPATCTVAMMHEPRFSSGAVHGGSFDNEDLFQALYETGVEMVLSGDDHLYERFAPQATYGLADPLGVRQFVVGTGGRSHYAFGPTQPNSEAQNNDAFGVLKLTLHPGSYDWSFVPEAGKAFTDTGSAACH